MNYRKAVEADIPAVAAIYEATHDLREKGEHYTGWIRGVYPTEATAREALARGELFVAEEEGEVAGTAILNQKQVDVYALAAWKYPAPPEQVMVMHTLVIHPARYGHGLGPGFVKFYEDYAREQGCTVLRIDTNEINTKARALYKRLGFREAGIFPCLFNGIENVQLVVLEKPVDGKNSERREPMLYDITQELFSCKVYPGDPAPAMERIRSIDKGDASNLTAFSMCAHNGTHVDAPFHFVGSGRTLDQLGLDPFVGQCAVVRREGFLSAADAASVLAEARAAGAAERVLLAGDVTVTAQAAEVFAAAGLKLLGNESQTFGPDEDHKTVHQILLGTGMVLLEGVVLKDVPAGTYLLNAAPLNLGGCEGAPCRAWLMG